MNKKTRQLKETILAYKKDFEELDSFYTKKEDAEFMDELLKTITKLEAKVDNLWLVISLITLVITIYFCYLYK